MKLKDYIQVGKWLSVVHWLNRLNPTKLMDMNKKQTFGVIIATRNIFNFQLAVEARKKVLTKLEKMGFGSVILPAEETPTGNIEGFPDAVKCADLFKKNADLIDGIIIILHPHPR